MKKWWNLAVAPTLLLCLVGCAQNASQADANANDTLSFAADRLDIKNLVASAFIKLDSFNLDEWSKAFTDNAVFVVIDAGDRLELNKEQLDRGMRERFRRFKAEKKQRRHVVTNIAFLSQTENSAHLKANGVVFSTQDHDKTEIASTIYLEGWMVKQEGVWRIQKWIVGNDARMNTRRAVESYGVQPEADKSR